MQNVFIEATNGPQNWGKFMVARFDEEWSRKSEVVAKEIAPEMERAAEWAGFSAEQREAFTRMPPLLHGIGWGETDIIVFDLQTCEGAAFTPRGSAHADLNKHKIWVCPLFEPFLAWLYIQDLSDLTKLPKHIDLPEAEFALYGYRREGK